jgi:hypothetical protein
MPDRRMLERPISQKRCIVCHIDFDECGRKPYLIWDPIRIKPVGRYRSSFYCYRCGIRQLRRCDSLFQLLRLDFQNGLHHVDSFETHPKVSEMDDTLVNRLSRLSATRSNKGDANAK